MNHSSVSPMHMRLRRFSRQARKQLTRFKNATFSMRTLISVIGIGIIAALFAIAITPVRYNISVGMVPTHTITANRDVVDEVTTESLRQQAEDSVQAVYTVVDGVPDAVLSSLSQIYSEMDAAIQYAETLEDYGPSRRYTSEELERARGLLTSIALRDYQLRTLLNTTRSDLSTLYTLLYEAIQNTMSNYIIEGTEYIAVSNIVQFLGYQVDSSLLQNVVQPLLTAIIRPNIVIDQEATAAAREQARADVEPVVYKQGQNIIVKGEGRVERYQYEMLSSMGLLSNTHINSTLYLGAALLVVLTMSVAMTLLRILRKDIVYDSKRLTLLFIILIFTFVCCVMTRLYNINLAPVALSALLISAMLGVRAAMVFNVAMSILVSSLAAGGSTTYTSEMVQMLTSSVISGSIGAMLLYKHSNRIRVILSGIAMGACGFLVMISLDLMTNSNMDSMAVHALWGLASGVISGILCVAAQPLLELIFNLPTPTKLMELSNPNHPLLRRLLLEAPGTYHHSIVVSSLAEAAAEAIGANPLLARVGGYYHDVGKLRRPLYFKENQLGEENKLIETDPYTAAQIVISHTRDGATLARQYHLPKEVIRIIQEHHGNTPVMYFYAKALEQANGKEVDVADFRYDANPPATKEGAIVLLCDTIEAAVRSMQNPTPEAIEGFIVKLVQGKLQDGQLSNCPLTLKDIDDICRACSTVLNGVFHERIEYPDPPAELEKRRETHEQQIEDTDEDSADDNNKELTTPWDGFSKEDFSTDDADFGKAPERLSSQELSSRLQQIPIDISEFGPEQPLPLVEVPEPEALPSVDDILKGIAKESLGSDAGAGKGKPNKGEA